MKYELSLPSTQIWGPQENRRKYYFACRIAFQISSGRLLGPVAAALLSAEYPVIWR